MKAIVCGMIATYRVGGVVWDYGQYALGLERLGFEVTYLEDSGLAPYDIDHRTYPAEPAEAAAGLERALRALSPSLAARWHYRDYRGETFGLAPEALAEAIAEADVFLNVSGCCLRRDAYAHARRAVLIDTDPGYNHFVNGPRWEAEPRRDDASSFRAHDVFFSYAQPGHALPDFGIVWHPTVPPVVRDRWQAGATAGSGWTTVMTWDNFAEPLDHEGVRYGTQEREFAHIESLPRETGLHLEIAVGGRQPPLGRWIGLGWRVVDSILVSATAEDYHAYITSSRGELSVAKNVYVATRSGWFSCRSVCYLAAGRPAVLQDTGFSRVVPTGEGLLAFADATGAGAARRAVEDDDVRHAAAARLVAVDVIDSDVVLAELLDVAGVS
jgi:hypothetical protein